MRTKESVVLGRKDFSEFEQDIWVATYAAAFATEYVLRLKHEIAESVKLNAEIAGYIAERAIRELRKWHKVEDPNLGHQLMDWSD